MTSVRMEARLEKIHALCWTLGTSPVHSFFFHNKDTFCYFGLFLVDSGRFQLTSTTSTTFLLVELLVIEHGHHVVSCSYQQP